jgi:hypothetical protein
MIRLLMVVSLLLGWTDSVHCHSGGTSGFATITINGASVRYGVTMAEIPPGAMADSMHIGQQNSVVDYRPLAEALRQKVRISSDGRECTDASPQITPPATKDKGVAVTLQFDCPQAGSRISIRDDMSDALGNDHHTLAIIMWSGGSQQFAFGTDARETAVTVSAAPEVSRGAGSFFPFGILHILTGYDHLVFLLALILRGGNVWSMLKIITAFTLAHSITLALAALNIIALPGRLIEAVIALSIVYVAVENLFLKHAVSHRWAVSFLFGLVHGFGFSNVLRELGLPREGLVWSLLNFNLGVETGQAVAVLLAVPSLLWIRRHPWESRIVTTISGVILLVGLGLFVGRVFFDAF